MNPSLRFAIKFLPLVSLLILVGCGEQTIVAPTPTSIPLPTATIAPTPTVAPTPTAVPTPTPTTVPVPTATSTPIPIPTATATPTPTSTPTPTPTPRLDTIIPETRKSIVKVTSGATQTSGVYLTNPSGYVLTASRPLGVSPKVVIETAAGVQSDGWIVGRDDSKNLALVKVSGLGIPSLSIGSSSGIKEGTEVLSFGYTQDAAGSPFIGQAQVTGIKNEYAIGLRFMQFDIEIEQGVAGGPVINREGDVVGINVDGSFLHSLNIAPGNSGYALVSDKFKGDLLTIKEGYMRTDDNELRPPPVPTSLSPPPQPIIFSGVARTGGLPVAKGERIWARVYGAAEGDLWLSALTGEDGEYKLTIGAVSRSYLNKPIEFYLKAKKHPTTARYTTVDGIEVFLDLVF